MSTNNGIELNFPIKRDRQPKVIVFEEPGKNIQINASKRKRPRTIDSKEEELDFVRIARDVKEFGVTGFTKKEQKKDKQKYAEYLGSHKQKQQKVPYPMLMERIKKKKLKEQREKELEKAMGIFKKNKKEDKVKISQKLNLGRWVDKSHLGNRKNNSIKVTKGEIQKVNAVKRTKQK